MVRVRSILFVIALGMTLYPAIPAAGTAPAAAPISTPISCALAPVTISAPGSYKLTGPPVVGCNKPTLVKITASKVKLDLGGLILNGDDVNCLVGISVEAPAVKAVTISNGTVSDCDTGVQLAATITKSTVTRVSVQSTEIDGIAGGSLNRFIQNAIRGTGRYGLNVDDRNVISGNSIAGSTNWGLFADERNVIMRNTISGGSTDAMFVLGNRNVFAGNVLADNAGDGICAIGDFDVITKNVVANNGGAGIEVQGDRSVVSGNTVTGSGAEGINALGETVTISKNTVSGSTLSGVSIDPPLSGGDTITSTKVIGNTSLHNSVDGIRLVDALDGTTKTIVLRNVVMDNVGQGINTNGPPDPVGARRNTAVGNGTDPQCDANLCP